MIRHILIIGQSVLSTATVLQSNKNPKVNMSNVPNIGAVDVNEANDPLSLGSDISPT